METTNLKNIARQGLTYNSKNFHWLNRTLDLERTMNGLEKPFRKQIQSKKLKKQYNIKAKLPHENNKRPARKRVYIQTQFLHSTLNLEQKISRRKITHFFVPLPVSAWPKSLLQFDFKNHETVWTDLKKRQRLNTIQILWIVNITE